MNLGKFKITNRGLYWGLIITFGVLYACVGFVSTLHSITFFHLANTMGLAVLLGLTYEIGQASVLFSILMTKNKDKFLPWALMILLTALQVSANVYASFKYMVGSGSNDWVYWQKSILFGIQSATPEMYQVIISWITGALLPVVALGMTALVANNMKLMSDEITQDNSEENTKDDEIVKKDNDKTYTENEVEEILNSHGIVTQPSDALIKTLENIDNKLNKEKKVELTLTEVDEKKSGIYPDYEDEILKNSESQLKEFNTRLSDSLVKNYIKYSNGKLPKTDFKLVNPQVEYEIPTILPDAQEQHEEWNKHYLTSTMVEDKIFNKLPDGWKPIDDEIHTENSEVNEFDGQLEPIINEDENLTPEELQEVFNVLNEENYEDNAEELSKDVDKKIVKSLLDSNEIIVNQPENLLETHTTIVSKEFPKRKPGRPPKKKDEDAAEPKKEQELLQKEEVKVPAKRKRHQDPLKKKSKISRIKRIEEINPPSKGDEVIALIENNEKERIKESINSASIIPQESPESILVPPEILEPYTQNGVEVIDAKAVAKKPKIEVDKFGIPIQPGERKNFDRI